MIKPFADLLTRFRKDERGVFLIIFALLAVVLIAASGAVVDFTRVQQARTRAQIALDAAALALQSTINNSGVTAATLKDKAQLLLTERIGDASVTAVVEAATPDKAAGKLTITGYISVPTYFVQLVGIKDIRSTMLSEVTRASSDLEVSLSIDITGSMALEDCSPWYNGCVTSDKIGALITASTTLIDFLVSTVQTPTYSKMAIVPWSYAVNPGTYLTNVRGTADATTTTISSVSSWSSGSTVAISSITRGSTTTINKNSHGFAVGDTIAFSGVSNLTNNGNSCINGKSFVISSKTTNSFVIPPNTNSCTSASNNSGTMQKCARALCELLITTSTNHGKNDGDPIYIANATGMTTLNGPAFVGYKTPTTMTLQGVYGPSMSGTYTTNSGRIYCGNNGCSYRTFVSTAGSISGFPVTGCVTERTTNPFNDSPPSTTKLGFHYTSGGTCLTNKIVPMTSDIPTLKTAIGPFKVSDRTLVASGTTAGHLGLAWGWYMIAPNFAYLWPTASQPKAYGSANLIKAIVFMTDGLFNADYCTGVATSTINCASPNGTSKVQAQAICDAIKVPANKTLLYVVGFDLADDADTLGFLRGCATSVDYFFQADNGTDLVAAFKTIAGSLSKLRVSK